MQLEGSVPTKHPAYCFFLFDVDPFAVPSLDPAASLVVAAADAGVVVAEPDPKNSFCFLSFSSSAVRFALASARANDGKSHCTIAFTNPTRL